MLASDGVGLRRNLSSAAAMPVICSPPIKDSTRFGEQSAPQGRDFRSVCSADSEEIPGLALSPSSRVQRRFTPVTAR